ncbi:hypothetical protein GCM10011609_33960 [Lentzea pudingi]|uniref:Uncharacterized protein n=1 Tax=Lentzea pudingi TaxID=1789439 RepID=A0ABQ2HWF4_9PSEU|nr:hypothetical protein GCM10011609_33960 [Lentzea pudingi]
MVHGLVNAVATSTSKLPTGWVKCISPVTAGIRRARTGSWDGVAAAASAAHHEIPVYGWLEYLLAHLVRRWGSLDGCGAGPKDAVQKREMLVVGRCPCRAALSAAARSGSMSGW